MNKKSQKVDDALVVGVMCSIILAMLIWTCTAMYDIQKDVKDIRSTLDTIQETLKSIDIDTSAKANDSE